MKKICYGILFLNLFSLNISWAMENDDSEPAAKRRKLEVQVEDVNVDALLEEFNEYWKEFDAATVIQKSWRGYAARKEAANFWVESISSNALKDLLAGKFNLKSTLEQINHAPCALRPFIIEKVMVLLIKNINFNADIKAKFSQEFFADLYAVIEGFLQGYGQDHLLYALKREFVDGPRNMPLKNEIHLLAANSKDLVMSLVLQFNDLLSDKSKLLSIFGTLDKSIDNIMVQIMQHTELISDKSLSQEFKDLLVQFRENHEMLTMMIKAYIFKSLSEGMLSAGTKGFSSMFGGSGNNDAPQV
jgi:hypothetical protein